jgi:uncharacterized protein
MKREGRIGATVHRNQAFPPCRRLCYGAAMTSLPPFHLAFPVHDLAAARAFYGGLLGCPEGRSADEWIDFDFFGHQIVAHLDSAMAPRRHSNEVDGEDVPVPHFGAVLGMAQWESLARRLEEAGTAFVIAPTVRFRGEAGEQATMFFLDPSGNAIEIKAMRDPAKLFARQ